MKFRIQNNVVSLASASYFPRITRTPWEGGDRYSVVKREVLRRSKNRPAGDNCPMLYALKGYDGLEVSQPMIELFYSLVERSIATYFKQALNIDLIFIIPSKSKVVYRFANLVATRYGIRQIDGSPFLKKLLPSELIERIKSNPDIPNNIEQAISTALRRDKTLNIKHIKTEYRAYLRPIFHPLLPYEREKIGEATHILLIDDIFASGLTLNSARDILIQLYPQATISALTLFGSIESSS